ncbi:MAG: Glycosyltransferases involved in cell wall biogenesis [Rhodobacteraceae bacterium HLUCCA12]|nr:MAG: Glycosyltransferases involved in cell wall biogenesis [Rhodobacteraceae bacterium HLUCCA12]
MTPALSVIIPASNEGDFIDACLQAVLASEDVSLAVVVAANGCTDDTAARARTHIAAFAARGWTLEVLDLPAPGKPGALNAGDAAARHPDRAYLDADVTVTPPLLGQIARVLSATPDARYASGQPRVAPARSAVTRAYARFWVRLPFVARGVPGFGLYAVNAAGRARWTDFPEIISDDTFVRLSFAPHERVRLPASYTWPMVEGFARLVRVRRRQDQGVAQVARQFPALPANDDTPRPGPGWLLRQALRDPVGFGVYTAVGLAVRIGWRGQSGWVRGR